MTSFLLWSSFLSTIRPLTSSDATAYYRPALVRTDSIPERDQRPRDNGYQFVFTNSWLVCQRNRSWIKGLGKYQQKEWTRSLFAVPFVLVHQTMTPWTPRNDCMYTSQAAQRVDKCPGRIHRNRNACLKVLRLSMGKILACIHSLRCKLVKGESHHKFIFAQPSFCQLYTFFIRMKRWYHQHYTK